MAENDIIIDIKTTADTAGTDTTVDGLEKVKKEIAIIDADEKKSLEQKKASQAEFADTTVDGLEKVKKEIAIIDAAEKKSLEQSTDTTVDGLEKVKKEIAIIDAAEKKSLEERKASQAEFAAWQKATIAEANAKKFRTAIPTLEEDQAAARVAAAASNAAAAEEAAAIRTARAAEIAAAASAEKALAEEAAAIKIEAALAKETLAAEEAAILGKKRLALESLRSVTPESRQLSAALAVAQNPATLAALANPYVLATAAVVTLGAVTSNVFDGIKHDMDGATAAGSKFVLENQRLSTVIEGIADPLAMAQDGFKTMFRGASNWAQQALVSVVGFFAGADKAAEMSNFKQMAARSVQDDFDKESVAARVKRHHDSTEKILADELTLQASLNSLAKGREQRAGTGADQVAANEVSRQIQKTAQEDALLIQKIQDAESDKRALIAKLNRNGIQRSEAEKAEINKDIGEAMDNIKSWSRELALKLKTDAADLTNTVESSQKEVKTTLETKLTDNAKALQEQLQGIVDSKGAEASPITRLALDKINAILADDKVTADEAGKLKAAMMLFRQSADSRSTEQQKWLTDLLAADKAAETSAKSLDTQITASTQNQAQVTEKVQATAEAQQTHHAATVESIATLAPTPADTKAVVTAVQDTGKAIADQGNAIIAALTSLQAVVAGITQQISNQQQQIEGLRAQIR